MTICFFGIYDKLYSRNRVILKGLRENGIEVIECNERSAGFIKYFKLIFKYFKTKKDFDYLWVAFPGQFCVLLAKLLTKKKIIFDCFTSHFQGLVEDRQLVKKNSLKARLYFWLDRTACQLANIVLLDTNEHIKYFTETFKLPKEKFIRLFVGSADQVFYPKAEAHNQIFTVHWHGHYIPLQGVQTIIEAAKILKDEQLIFNLIGQGQERTTCQKLAEDYRLKNLNFIDNVSYEKLAELQARADVCLGIFGQTKKAQLVIPNKAYEALAMGKALITAKTPASKELLTDQENVLLVEPGQADELANKILILKNNNELRKKIGNNAYQLFISQLTPKILINEFFKKLE